MLNFPNTWDSSSQVWSSQEDWNVQQRRKEGLEKGGEGGCWREGGGDWKEPRGDIDSFAPLEAGRRKARVATTAADTRAAERILIDFRGGVAARAKFGKGTIYKYSEKVTYVFKARKVRLLEWIF